MGKEVNAWILRLAATVLDKVDGDHLDLEKKLTEVADGLEGSVSSTTEDAWASTPDIREVEQIVKDRDWFDLDENYIASISRFAVEGLSVAQLKEFASTAYSWRYFCGMCWKTIRSQ